MKKTRRRYDRDFKVSVLKKCLRHDPEEGTRGETKADVEGRHMIIQEAQ